MTIDDHADPDEEARRHALHVLVRRAVIWTIPLTAAGLLLAALGIPAWISIVTMLVTLAVLVLDIDF
jgi:uncharacterized membrane protein YkvI